jgi:predicted secreted hydrolase
MRRVPAALLLVLSALCTAAASYAATYASVTAGEQLKFPVDYGSHPEFRTEWWYITGWLTTQRGETLGFQITFFRAKPDVADDNPSSFNPRQILIAHCAISDPKRGRLWQDQRVRRAGMGLVEAAQGDTAVSIDGWSLTRQDGHYLARIQAENFSFDLTLAATQPMLLNGEAGMSRKGPSPASASYYYSEPHLRVQGSIARQGARSPVSGEAWLDHEWSSEYLDDQAVGWDWLGLNFDDGAALMAFRIRGTNGEQRWAGGTLRSADGSVEILGPQDIDFREGRRWVSGRTAISYPVEWLVRVGGLTLAIKPLLDDQENDTRLTTGAIYWEGAVQASAGGKLLGRGYLELTGYGDRLKLP